MATLSEALKINNSFSGLSGCDFLFLKMGSTFKKFSFQEIIFIEAYGTKTKLITETGNYVINDSIAKIEERLNFLDFLRVHKSFIINIQKIVSVDRLSLELTLGKVPIGRSYKQKIEHLLEVGR